MDSDADNAPDPRLGLPEGWAETRYETGGYGPDDVRGFAAEFEHGEGTMEAAVRPGRFRRREGSERFTALHSEVEITRTDPAVADRPTLPPTTVFAATVAFEPGARTRQAALCFAADAGDALAAVLWVLAAADTDWELNRNVALHSGAPVSGIRGVVPDEDALTAALAEAPERCVFTGRPTRSHTLSLPLRYARALAGYPTTDRGVPRIPPTAAAGALRGVVSHAAWEEQGLDDLDTGAALEREESGVYRLDAGVLDAVAGLDATRFALAPLGE